jgi:hypothetical protein
MPGPIPGRLGRRNGQTGGAILQAHIYRNEEKRMCELLPGLVLFRLMALARQPGVMGSYPTQGAWFPSRLLLEGTDHIQNYGP